MSIERKVKNKELRDTVYSGESEIHGTGLFAMRYIEEGEYIGTYHGPKTKKNGTHVLWVYENGEKKKPTGWNGKNLLRFLNHSDDCNAEFDGRDLYALTDIDADQEITFDYGW
jgi:SET domain-containing protein